MDWGLKPGCRWRPSAARQRSSNLSLITAYRRVLRRRSGQQLDHFLERHHVDRVVVSRASEFALLWRGRIAQRHAQAAADAEVGANGTDHPAVDVGFLDDA